MTPDQAWHEQQEHYFKSVKTLDQIGIHFQTDKASQFSRTYAKPHDYLRHLERFVESMRYNPIKILEIGVGGGESIQTWLEYFEQAKVFGVDLVHDTNPWNTPNKYLGADIGSRYTFCYGSQSDHDFWYNFTADVCGVLDVVIDDGSHLASDMKIAFTCLWSHLKSGGVYIVEDLNFDGNSKVWTESLISHIHAATTDIDSIYFARELAILRKK